MGMRHAMATGKPLIDLSDEATRRVVGEIVGITIDRQLDLGLADAGGGCRSMNRNHPMRR